MSISSIFAQSWVIGFAIAAPIGPIGMLCIRKTMELGFQGALSVGLGASIADGLLGFVVGAGLTVLTGAILENDLYIKLIGGGFLLYLGIREFLRENMPNSKISSKRRKFLTLTSQTFFLALASPMTIMSFIAVFASIGGPEVTMDETIWMVLGIFCGSMSWWIILGKIVTFSKGYLSETWQNRVRYFSACILIAFGGWAVVSSFA